MKRNCAMALAVTFALVPAAFNYPGGEIEKVEVAELQVAFAEEEGKAAGIETEKERQKTDEEGNRATEIQEKKRRMKSRLLDGGC